MVSKLIEIRKEVQSPWFVVNKELESKKFQKFQENLRKHMGELAIIYN